MFRHQPPAATPLSIAQWRQGWIQIQPDTRPFAEQIAAYLKVPACYTAASGRAALFSLLQAIQDNRDRPKRNRVLLPAYTCPALVQVIADLDLKPVPVEVVPATLDFQPEALFHHLDHQTLAVIYVHPFGLPQPVHMILEEAQTAGAVVIEDAAQALGAFLRGQPVGTWGDVGLFSLGPGKALSVGGGGIVCAGHPFQQSFLDRTWEDLPPPGRTASLMAQARLVAFHLAFHPAGWWLANRLGARRYGNSETGRGYRVRDMSAAQKNIAAALLPRLSEINRTRQEHAQNLLSALKGCRQVKPIRLTVGSEPTYLRLPLLAGDNETRDRLVAALNNAGIGAGKMYNQALPALFPAMKLPPCPGADDLAARLLTLPTHHYLTGRDITTIVDIVSGKQLPNMT